MKSQKDPCPKQPLQSMGSWCSFKGNTLSADVKQNSLSLGQDPLPTNGDDMPQPFHSMSPSTELSNSERHLAEDSEDNSEQLTDSTSMWSEISQLYGGPPMFSRFTLEMVEQCLRDEELRARHQSALLRLREEALQEKTKAELSWLEHQKMRLDVKRDYQKLADLIKQQQDILSRLQQEQAEISHLHNIYRAAHQERKLLLKQQRAIERMQRSTAHLQQKLYGSGQGQQFFSGQRSVRQKSAKTSKPPDEEPAIPAVSLSERGDAHLQIKQNKNNTSPCTQKDETPAECSPPGEGQRSDAQDMEVLEAIMPVDPNNDTTDQVSEEHSIENREMHNQLSVPLEYPEQTQPVVLPNKSMEDHSCHVTVRAECRNDACAEGQKRRPLKDGELEESCSRDIYSDFSASMEDMSSSLIEEDIEVLVEAQNEKELPKTKEHLGDVSGNESTSDLVLDLNINTAAKLEMRNVPSEELRGNLDLTHEEGKSSYAEGQDIKELPTPLQQEVSNAILNPEPDGAGAERNCSHFLPNNHQVAPLDTTMVNKQEKEKASGHAEERSLNSEQSAVHASSDQTESFAEASVLKAHPSSIASTESSNSSHESENVTSYTLLSEFQKVSAVLIDISESSVSLSDAENIQDTDISEHEVSDTEEKEAELVKEGNRLLFSMKSNEPLHHETNESVALQAFKLDSEIQSNISAQSTVPEFHVIILSNKGTQMPLKKEPNLFQGEESTGRAEELPDETLRVCLEEYKEKQLTSERDSDPEESLASSGSLNISLSYSESFTDVDEYLEQSPITLVDKTEMDSDVGQSKGVYVFKDCVKTVSPVTEELNITISLQPENATSSEKVPVAVISSISDNSTDNEKHSVEGQIWSESDKMAPVQKSNLMNPKDVVNTTETCSSGIKDLQIVGNDNEKESTIEEITSKKTETVLFLVDSSKDLLSQNNSLKPQSEESVPFISDEALIPIDEDTLSEILSPVDEVLSYKTADLFSIERDFSFPREDLPSPPEQAASINSDEVNDNTEDFPSPPEQMMESENEGLDHILDEQTLLSDLTIPPSEIMFEPSVEDGNVLAWPMDAKNIFQEKKDPESQQMGSSCIPDTDFPCSRNKESKIFRKQLKPFLTLSEAEVDNIDPILFYEIGCRVLVKQTQPGTLKYKGYTSFDEGYWAGVALDNPEGDHDGTYKGVKYFECDKNCGIFVRPNQISHILEEAGNSLGSSADEDPYDDASPPEDYKAGNQQRKKLEQKSKEKYNKTGNPSASMENNSRSCMSVEAGQEIKEKPPNTGQYGDNESTPQSFSVHLEPVDDAAERLPVKGDPTESYSEVAVSMVEKENSLDRHEKKMRSIQTLQEAEREKLAEDICTELTRNLLCDALIAFSETSHKKCKSILKKNNMKTTKYLGEKYQHKWELSQEICSNSSEQSSEVLDWSMHDLDTLKNHVKCHPKFTPQEAKTIADKIVAKLIDDAMKEYKKITKRQGEKLENNMLISSGMTHATLPFLRKLLDAGIFGGSGDFGQLGSVLSTEGITQRQNLYRLDHWHSAPWKETEEVAFVVPHNSSYVKKLVACMVDALWSGRTGFSKSERVSMLQDYEWEEVTEDGWNAESRRVYNQVISDLTHELLRSRSEPSRNSSVQPWLKDTLSTRCSNHSFRKEVKSFIQEEVVKILNLEGNDLKTKRKLRQITKFENHRRDRVDLLLIQELQKEEAEWTEYSEDELAVKMKITEDIFDLLIVDTIEILKKIYLRKTQF